MAEEEVEVIDCGLLDADFVGEMNAVDERGVLARGGVVVRAWQHFTGADLPPLTALNDHHLSHSVGERLKAVEQHAEVLGVVLEDKLVHVELSAAVMKDEVGLELRIEMNVFGTRGEGGEGGNRRRQRGDRDGIRGSLTECLIGLTSRILSTGHVTECPVDKD